MPLPSAEPGETVVGFDECAGWITSGRALWKLARYGESRMLVHRLESAGRPLPLSLALRWMTRGVVRIEDERGRTRTIDGDALADWIVQVTREPFEKRALLRGIEQDGAAKAACSRRSSCSKVSVCALRRLKS